jgi:HlyD family secretion protein
MRNYLPLWSAISFLLFSCGNDESPTDATGVFESAEIIVAAETAGKILSLDIREGDQLQKGQPAGLLDSMQLHLSKLQLEASKFAIEAGRPDVQARIEATEKDIARQQREKKRIEKLLEGDVATQKQLDDIEAAIQILKAKLRSQKSTLANSVNTVDAQIITIDAQIAQLDDQISRCLIKSPINGTVLVKYAEAGEVAGPGRALFKIADMEQMILRAYITADQLAKVQVGQEVDVLAEFGEKETRAYHGKVTWISESAEFTPKTIQTQDERANLVYATKIAVKNDGFLKIGMYGGFKKSQK